MHWDCSFRELEIAYNWRILVLVILASYELKRVNNEMVRKVSDGAFYKAPYYAALYNEERLWSTTTW
jgi:hypothetical protein